MGGLNGFNRKPFLSDISSRFICKIQNPPHMNRVPRWARHFDTIYWLFVSLSAKKSSGRPQTPEGAVNSIAAKYAHTVL